jgi:hypothetical protein
MPGFPIGKLGKRYLRSLAPQVLCVVFCAVSFSAAVSHADSPTGDTLELPASETRGVSAPPPAPGVYRLEGESLRRFATLEDALASLPGFHVRRQGGLGGYSALSFRGARASAVEVYVDGVRLNQDGDAAPDLAKWPSLWFSSLEARTGLDATGAAGAAPGTLARIDLSTGPDPAAGVEDTHGTDIRARAGSFSVFESAVVVRGGWGGGSAGGRGAVGTLRQAPRGARWLWNVGLEGQTARNDYTYFDDNATDYNTADDAVRHMENNGYWSRGLRGALKREDAKSRQTLSLLWLESRKEYPGRFSAEALAYTRRADWLAAWRFERFGGPATWELGLQGRRFADVYRDPAQSLGYFSFESARVSLSAEADARARLAAADFLAWSPQALLRTESVEPTAAPFTQTDPSPSARRHEAQFGSALEARAGKGLSATVEARAAAVLFLADGALPFPDSGDGRIAREDRFPLALRAGLRRDAGGHSVGGMARLEQRAPSSGELMGDNNGVRRNLDLRAEETRGASVFHSVKGSGWSLQSTAFLNLYRNPIRLGAYGSSPFLRHANAADHHAMGLEALAHAGGRHADGSLSLTAQEAAIDEGPYAGNRPAYQSAVDAHAEFFWKPAFWRAAGARLGALVDYRGSYHPADANIPDARRPAEWEWGAHAGAGRGPLRASLEARNLTDRRYRDFAYSPRSGRSYAFNLSLNL